MRRRHVRSLALLMCTAAGCATAGGGGAQTALTVKERGLLAKSAPAEGGTFQPRWVAPTAATAGLLKWDEDRSTVIAAAPSDLLQAIRDEVGRLNQQAGAGPDVRIAIAVTQFVDAGVFAPARARYDLGAKTATGEIVLVAEDEVAIDLSRAPSLADTDTTLIARTVAAKLAAVLRR